MRCIKYFFLLFLITNNAQAGFLCNMLILDIQQTHAYEDSLNALKEIKRTAEEVALIKRNLQGEYDLSEIEPGAAALYSTLIPILKSEEKNLTKNAAASITSDAGALIVALMLYRSYVKNPQSLGSIVDDSFRKNFNHKVWQIPSLLAAIGASIYFKKKMINKKQDIITLRKYMDILAAAEVKDAHISQLEDIINENFDLLHADKQRYMSKGCLKKLQYEDRLNITCEEDTSESSCF